jgi:hypothetical protein
MSNDLQLMLNVVGFERVHWAGRGVSIAAELRGGN